MQYVRAYAQPSTIVPPAGTDHKNTLATAMHSFSLNLVAPLRSAIYRPSNNPTIVRYLSSWQPLPALLFRESVKGPRREAVIHSTVSTHQHHIPTSVRMLRYKV